MSDPLHLHLPRDDAPPPPYSETDVRDNSADAESPRDLSQPGPVGFDSCSGVSSATGEVIYTPPLTPQSPHASLQGQGWEECRSGASFYFESRPPPARLRSEVPRQHTIDLQRDSVPQDFPYCSAWATQDITGQDWTTFLNFLLPDHSSRSNETVIDRKLRAETEADATGPDAAADVRRHHAEAQLDRLQVEKMSEISQHSDAGQTKRREDATVKEWNENFFQPRGMVVQIISGDWNRPMPGSWNEFPDAGRAQNDPWSSPTSNASRSRVGPLGSLRIDAYGVELGNSITIGSTGLRIGNLTIDPYGIRYSAEREPSGSTQSSLDHVPFLSSLSRWLPGLGLSDAPIPSAQHDLATRRRSLSVSSISSLSSASDASIGSIPDYDELDTTQLAIFVSRLREWTSQPEHLRTRAEMQLVKQDLQRASLQSSSARGNKPVVDRASLRTLRKDLAKIWRTLGEQQKRLHQARKAEMRRKKRAERQRKRDLKRERRNVKRNVRGARRESLHACDADRFRSPLPRTAAPSIPVPFRSEEAALQSDGYASLGPENRTSPDGGRDPDALGPRSPHWELGVPTQGGTPSMHPDPRVVQSTGAPGSWPEVSPAGTAVGSGPPAADRCPLVESLEKELARKLAEFESGEEQGSSRKAEDVGTLVDLLESLKVGFGEEHALLCAATK